LYKTTIVIWSEEDPENYELEDLAREATNGSMYCSSVQAKKIENPEKDSDWDDTEFFVEEDDNDEDA
jgi:hypothetical protein